MGTSLPNERSNTYCDPTLSMTNHITFQALGRGDDGGIADGASFTSGPTKASSVSLIDFINKCPKKGRQFPVPATQFDAKAAPGHHRLAWRISAQTAVARRGIFYHFSEQLCSVRQASFGPSTVGPTCDGCDTTQYNLSNYGCLSV